MEGQNYDKQKALDDKNEQERIEEQQKLEKRRSVILDSSYSPQKSMNGSIKGGRLAIIDTENDADDILDDNENVNGEFDDNQESDMGFEKISDDDEGLEDL